MSSKGVLMQVPGMRMLKFCEHQKLLEHQNSLGRREHVMVAKTLVLIPISCKIETLKIRI